MSSRNLRLNSEDHKAALIFNKALIFAKDELSKGKDFKFVQEKVRAMCLLETRIRLEYFELADAEDLNLLDKLKENGQSILLIAGFVGEVRLIDNMFV